MNQTYCSSLSRVVSLAALRSLRSRGYSKTQDFRPATPEELAMKSVAGDAGAEAAILDWVRIDDDTDADVLRVLPHQDPHRGREEARGHRAAVCAGLSALRRSHRHRGAHDPPDGTIVPFDGKIYDKVAVQGRAAPAVRAKTFTLPDVQPGSIIEYRYIRRWTEQYLLNTYWSVQRDIPVLHVVVHALAVPRRANSAASSRSSACRRAKMPRSCARSVRARAREHARAARRSSSCRPRIRCARA